MSRRSSLPAPPELSDVEGHTGATTLLELRLRADRARGCADPGTERAWPGRPDRGSGRARQNKSARRGMGNGRRGGLERDFAYGCVRQLLEPLVAKTSSAERDRLFEGAAALSKPLFAPSHARNPPRPTAPSRSCTVSTGCSTTSPTGVPLPSPVDDIHWSDTESLRFFNYLAPRLDGLPLAVLASTRSGEGVRRPWPGWPPVPRPPSCGPHR